MKTPHIINQWALRNGVAPHVVDELLQLMIGQQSPVNTNHCQHSEAYVQSAVTLEAARVGARLWRNNVGACEDKHSKRLIRYGLCNESKAMNRVCKSSDLVGIKPILITPDMVGSTIGQFVAREVKKPTWNYSGGSHEEAQLNFLMMCIALGGDAQFVNSEGSL